MKKYKNKYRSESNRLANWDYSAKGLYFITIVTQKMECNLGHIENEKMILSDFGKIVDQEWHKSFEIRTALILHAFIIMPNHLHAIIEIAKNSPPPNANKNEIENENPAPQHSRVAEIPNPSPIPNSSPKKHPIPHLIRLPKSISSFIAGFKSAVNSKIDDYIDLHQLSIPKYNRDNHFFQSNYHDRIIWDINSYHRIKKYIQNNPAMWGKPKKKK